MFQFIVLSLGTLVRLLRVRRSLLLENLALRQQLAVLKRQHPKPRVGLLDKLFWVAVRRVWSGWKQSLIVVTPETVVRWYRAGFRLYWRLISRARTQMGRSQTSREVRELILRVRVENPTQRHEAPGEHLDHPSATRSLPLRGGVQISHLRPGCEIRLGGPGGRSIPEDEPGADLLRESLAKRCDGALGRKLPTRHVGSYYRGECTPSETASL